MAWESLSKAFRDIWSSLEPHKEQLKYVAYVLLAALAIGIVGPIAAIIAFIAILSVVIRSLSAVIGWIVNVIQWLEDLRSKVWNFFITLNTTVYNALLTVRDTFYNAGKEMILSLARGLTENVSKATDAVKGVMRRVKDFLPSSPAKKGAFSGKGWTLYSGQTMMQGLATGINNRSNLPVKAMSSVMQEVSSQQNTNIYGNISIGSQQDSDYFFSRLSRDQELASMGVSS
jgi:hypothetical protein